MTSQPALLRYDDVTTSIISLERLYTFKTCTLFVRGNHLLFRGEGNRLPNYKRTFPGLVPLRTSNVCGKGWRDSCVLDGLIHTAGVLHLDSKQYHLFLVWNNAKNHAGCSSEEQLAHGYTMASAS